MGYRDTNCMCLCGQALLWTVGKAYTMLSGKIALYHGLAKCKMYEHLHNTGIHCFCLIADSHHSNQTPFL